VSETERPVLRVVTGDATPEEIAAIVAAVAAAPAPEAVEEPTATSLWAAHGYAHRHIRATFVPSRDGWRASFWPR
jgi:hypothetical protein